MNVKTILFPTDYSHSSDAALSYASSLAGNLGAMLYIVHVGNETPNYLAGYYGVEGVPDSAQHVERENRALLEKIKPTVPNVRFEHQYLSGSPDKEILAFADRENVDLIVLGSHGRTGITRLLLGSIAEAVVRRANCPVLTVKQPAGEGLDSVVAPQEAAEHSVAQPNEA